MEITANSIYQAECLELLKRLSPGQVDLVYLDPPEETAGKAPEASLIETLKEVRRVVSDSGLIVFHHSAIATRNIRQESETLLNETLGAASNDNARQLLAGIFGAENFMAEFSWPGRRGVAGRRYLAGTHDTILVFSKSPEHEFDHCRVSFLTTDGLDETRRFAWKGCIPASKHVWKWTPEELDRLEANNRMDWNNEDRFPMLKTYIFEEKGVQVAPVWYDIPPVSPSTREYTGWPLQRPIALLDRIIKLGSNPGDVVLDPFCGSGTSLLSAQANGRKWIGCEISSKGVETSISRLERGLGLRKERDFKVGNSADLSD